MSKTFIPFDGKRQPEGEAKLQVSPFSQQWAYLAAAEKERSEWSWRSPWHEASVMGDTGVDP